MATIVHISTDYPDAVQPRKTRAIANLVASTADSFDHRVYSLNRVAISPLRAFSSGAVCCVADDGALASWTYDAPSHSFFLATALTRVGDRIAEDLVRKAIKPDLIQGHKLSMEGIVAARVASAFGVPYALTLQGDSDERITRVRRDLRGLYTRIFQGAAHTFPMTPWIADIMAKRFGASMRPPVLLPCISQNDTIIIPRMTGPRLVSMFHLESYQRKNACTLIAAAARAVKVLPELSLDIGGGGPGEAVSAINALIAASGCTAIRPVGPVPHAGVGTWMNGAAGLVLPSRRETFGMVFIEALMAGCPIVYPRGMAVDGYFDGCSFAIGVPAGDPAAIADAMLALVRDQARLKADLGRWQINDAARFQRAHVADSYAAGLRLAIE